MCVEGFAIVEVVVVAAGVVVSVGCTSRLLYVRLFSGAPAGVALVVVVVVDVVVVVVDIAVETPVVVVGVVDFFIGVEVVVVDLCQNFALVPP